MSKATGPQRPIELLHWMRFAYVCDVADLTIHIRRGVLNPDEVNAASNTTIIIDRMLRAGRSSWRRRLLNSLIRHNRPGSKP
jgi:hypothetical protein